MKNKTQQYLVIMLAHFLIYPVYFDGMSKSVQQLIIFGAIGIYVFFNFNNIQPLYRSLGNYKKAGIIGGIFLLLLLSASVLIPIFYGTVDFSYFGELMGSTLYLVFYILLVALIRKYFVKDTTKIKILEIVARVQQNYVLVTFLFLLFPRLKNLWMNTIILTPRAMQLIQDPAYISRVSWDGYAGFTSTVYSTIAVIASIYLFIEYYKEHRAVSRKYLTSLFFALIGNAFYGRAGLLVSLLMVGIGVLYLVIVYKQYKIFYSLIGAIVLLFLFITLLSSFNATVASWYSWAMEPIISLFETGEIETASTNQLWDMWFIPDLKTILIGDGYYSSPTHSGYYMETDVGYLRPVLFFGLFFTAIYYLLPFILSFEIINNDHKNKLLIAMLLLSILIFEVKGEVVFKFLPLITMLFVAEYIKEPESIMSSYPERNLQLGGTSYNEIFMDRN